MRSRLTNVFLPLGVVVPIARLAEAPTIAVGIAKLAAMVKFVQIIAPMTAQSANIEKTSGIRRYYY